MFIHGKNLLAWIGDFFGKNHVIRYNSKDD